MASMALKCCHAYSCATWYLLYWLQHPVQVAEIAERSTDGAARAAACELLHAATLKMIGERPFAASDDW